MEGLYVVVSSITYAYKGKNALERKGIRAYIERPPRNLSKCGCHYALRIKNAPLDKAVQILMDARVRIITSGGASDDLS